jgi:signal transduction histidine kinase/CheY-like chemotaxis protein
MGFEPSVLQAMLIEQNLPPGWIATVLDSKGIVVARTSSPENFVGKTARPEFFQQIGTSREGTIETQNLQGEASLASFSRLPSSGWSVVVSVRKRQLAANLHRNLWLTAGSATGLLLLAGLTAKLASRRMARAIRSLIDPALALASGQTFVPPITEIAEVHDVVQALSKASHLLEQRAIARDGAELAEREMAIAKSAAEASAAAKSKFLATMSHEIRTPMNAVLGFAQLLDRTPLSPDQLDYVTKILGSGRALLALINNILDFSNSEAGLLVLEEDRFSLDEVLDEMCDVMARSAATKPLELALAVEPDVPDHLVGDGSRLRQILINLVGNAIKFTASGSVLVRVAADAEKDGRILLHVAVVDTGIGMDESALIWVFEPFTQADSSTTRLFDGSGLGLALCKRIAEQMGGTISVESCRGVGSTFRLTLPFNPDGIAISAADPVISICLIEAHPMSRMALETTMRSLGWAIDRSPTDFVLRSGTDTATSTEISGIGAPSAMVLLPTVSDAKTLNGGAPGPVLASLTKPISRMALRDAVRSYVRPPLPSPPLPVTRLSGLRILIVEDNPVNQMVAKALLKREGALTAVAENGAVALDMLRAEPNMFDLILMDIQMPVMGGLEAARAIRADLGLTGLPIVACTAGVLETERERASAAGMNDFITKPIAAEILVQTIRRNFYRPADREPPTLH